MPEVVPELQAYLGAQVPAQGLALLFLSAAAPLAETSILTIKRHAVTGLSQALIQVLNFHHVFWNTLHLSSCCPCPQELDAPEKVQRASIFNIGAHQNTRSMCPNLRPYNHRICIRDKEPPVPAPRGPRQPIWS